MPVNQSNHTYHIQNHRLLPVTLPKEKMALNQLFSVGEDLALGPTRAEDSLSDAFVINHSAGKKLDVPGFKE